MYAQMIPILNVIKEWYFGDSSDEEEEGNVIEKIESFAEITVPLRTDQEFKEHFRMIQSTFEDLLRKVDSVMNYETKKGYPRTKLEKELMVSIWYLGNIDFRSVANRFGISKSTCWEILLRIGNLLLKVNREYNIFCFPSKAKQQRIAQNL